MSQTLYRKYRSQTFADIIGQSSVVRILGNAIRRQRINHAYLFAGPRGTGKTSIARIFAKALNCLNPRDGDACGVCAVCTSIAAGSNVDVIEIDAASNRGIDDIRDLRERVGYAPLELRWKVYIIDEVHMITREGFNALLKTLEEPPEHVVFCLCTTEANKVPITILSRCVRFDFQRLPLDALTEHLVNIAVREGFALSRENGMRLALLAEGSARDAISLLDQLTVYCEGEIRGEDIAELFQLGDPELTAKVVALLETGRTDEALATWTELLGRGVDAGTFLVQLADSIKERFLAEPQPGWGAALEVVWQGLNLLKYDSFPALLVELTLLQVGDALAGRLHGRSVAPPREADPMRETTVRAVETHRPSPAPKQPEPAQVERAERAVETPAPVPRAAAPLPQPVPPTDPVGPWGEFVAAVRRRRLTTYAVLVEGVGAELRDDELSLHFAPEQRFALSIAQKQENIEVLTDAAREVYGPETTLVLREGRASGDPYPEPPAQENGVQSEPSGVESAHPAEPRGVTFEDVAELFGAEEIGPQ